MTKGEMVTIKAERDALARHIETLTESISDHEVGAFKEEWKRMITLGLRDHDAILAALAGFLARRQSAGQFAAFS